MPSTNLKPSLKMSTNIHGTILLLSLTTLTIALGLITQTYFTRKRKIDQDASRAKKAKKENVSEIHEDCRSDKSEQDRSDVGIEGEEAESPQSRGEIVLGSQEVVSDVQTASPITTIQEMEIETGQDGEVVKGEENQHVGEGDSGKDEVEENGDKEGEEEYVVLSKSGWYSPKDRV